MGYAGRARADAAVAEQVDVLTRALVGRVSQICAVYLAGSFGRAEGSVIPWGTGWRPLGDYDFYVVGTAAVRAHLARHHLCDLWERRFGGAGPAFGITVEAMRESSLVSLPPDTSTLEFKQAATLLYGREVRHRITFGAELVPVSSGLRPLLNKLVGLLKHAPNMEAFSSQDLEYEVWKLYLDGVAALLLSWGRYRAGYRARGSLFATEARLHDEVSVPDLQQKAAWALERKLRPVFSCEYPENLWAQAKADLAALVRHVAESIGGPTGSSLPRWLSGWLRRGYYAGWIRAGLLAHLGVAPDAVVQVLASAARRREARRYGAGCHVHLPAALYGAAAWCLYGESDADFGEGWRLLRDAGAAAGGGRAALRAAVLRAFDRYRDTKPAKRGIGV